MESLECMLKLADKCPVTIEETDVEAEALQAGACLRLTWVLTIHEFPLTWIEHQGSI